MRGPVRQVALEDFEDWALPVQDVLFHPISHWRLAIILKVEEDKAEIGLRPLERRQASLKKTRNRKYIWTVLNGPANQGWVRAKYLICKRCLISGDFSVEKSGAGHILRQILMNGGLA